jgi:hypothetical protein
MKYTNAEYLNKKEQDDMLEEFWEFDRMLIHEKYQDIVEGLETRKY